MSKQSSREEELFAGALALAPDQRATYLAQACDRDATLRTRIEALLEANDSANNPLDAAPGAVVRDALAKPPDESPGAMIGRYKLLQKIGEGGCGGVYMAEQREPVVRRVALKVIKLGMDTREVIARFEAERQALAMMDHPNIARVFDAGATDQGRPFFVMELVRGVPIVKYCDQQKLPIRARIELFTQICQAVQHAHQKGIIHRDLKPSNILVTLQDGVPVPKVIDFGIAKATQGRLTDRTLFTAFEQFVGTPAYMSPEQAELSSVDVDTRSDIYSLGVLLYELLTGRTPFETTDLLKAGLDEMRRQIREVEPPKPSTRLQTLEAETLSVTARHHAIGPPRLIHLVRGDLDWIVMKCLEKDRARRYETAASLAQDLAHFLADEPVLAAAPTAWYKLRKLTRRHRTLVITGISFAVALVTVAVGSAVLAFRASRLERAATEAKREAEAASRTAHEAAAVGLAVEEFLRVNLLAGTGGATRDETALCDRLDRATAQLRDQPPANPLVEIAIRENLAAGYRSLGLHTSLQAQLARITELYQRQRGASDAQTIQASRNLRLALAETNSPPTRELPPLRPASNEPSPPPPVVPEATVALPATAAAAPSAANPAPPENPPVLQPLVINLGTFLPHGTTQERLVLRMAESWRAATAGKITLRVFSDGRAGNESEIVTLVENRKLQAALMTVVGMEEIENGVVGLQKNTLGYSSLAEFDYVAEHLTPELEARLQRKGLTVLFWSDGGWMQLFSRHPVESPADLKALRLYMWAGRPAHVEIMRRAGFKPVPLEVGDYISAFRNGLIDAGSLPPFLALSYQIDSYAPHMLLLNSEPLIGVCVIRRDTWDSIPPETRERLLAIARTTGREITASARRESDAAIAAMQKRNLTVHTVPAAAAAEWHAIAQEFRPLIRGRIVDPVIYDRVQALIAEYRASHPREAVVP